MIEKAKTPRAFTRHVLSLAEQSKVLEDLSPEIKAEVYGIMAYFINKATNASMQWVHDNPGHVLVADMTFDVYKMKQQTSIESFEEASLLSSENVTTILHTIYQILVGVMHFHMKELVNTYTPGPMVNERDAHILERLDDLLIGQLFRDGRRKHSEQFLLDTTEPQARFIVTTLYAAFAAYAVKFNRLPDPESPHFADIVNSAKKMLLKMSSMNLQDFGKIENKMKITESVGDNYVISSPLSKGMVVDVTEQGAIRIHNSTLDAYEVSKEASAAEATIGCPALFTKQADGGNAIVVLIDYAASLIKKSGAMQDYQNE